MKNLIIQVTMLSVLNGISSLASGYVYSIIYPDEDLFGKVVFTDYIDLTILSTTYLVVFLMNRYKKEETTALQTKLKNLSMQTDNHFIFNCFGTLSGLIEEAPQQAILFLDKLSDTYRYLVTNGSSPLVTIKEELNFVDNYTALIKYRYSGIELLYDDTVRNGISGYVCPIALQSLVENAIKHNRHGKNNHLTIIISSDGKYITVTNNIMPRQNDAHSTGNGLAYLKERYSILTKEKVRISSDDRIFSVSLPIINP
ncbi:MAG: histidine kinase [Lachnospiraceae bacterium]|nr:histidine kinase [Lachnospiraceae bacterium]